VYTLVRRIIKTGIGFLFAGLALGRFLILGVALWLFPRAAKDDARYRPERMVAAYWLLTAATAARVLWPRIRPVGSHLRQAAGERF
jgi:hypothetical protein